jgi:uncharacterized membrane protein YkvA (DUF1232 family)
VRPQSGLSCEAKIALAVVGTILYIVSPVDGIPDVFLGIGWLDDLGVFGVGVAYCLAVWKEINDRSKGPPPHTQVIDAQVVPRNGGFKAYGSNGTAIDVEVID